MGSLKYVLFYFDICVACRFLGLEHGRWCCNRILDVFLGFYQIDNFMDVVFFSIKILTDTTTFVPPNNQRMSRLFCIDKFFIDQFNILTPIILPRQRQSKDKTH